MFATTAGFMYKVTKLLLVLSKFVGLPILKILLNYLKYM
jgi:hypothetical protein